MSKSMDELMKALCEAPEVEELLARAGLTAPQAARLIESHKFRSHVKGWRMLLRLVRDLRAQSHSLEGIRALLKLLQSDKEEMQLKAAQLLVALGKERQAVEPKTAAVSAGTRAGMLDPHKMLDVAADAVVEVLQAAAMGEGPSKEDVSEEAPAEPA